MHTYDLLQSESILVLPGNQEALHHTEPQPSMLPLTYNQLLITNSWHQ